MDGATAQRVDERWHEYGLDKIARALSRRRVVGARAARLRSPFARADRVDADEAARRSSSARSASSTRSLRCRLPTSARCWRRAAYRSRRPCGWITLAVLGARTAAMAANRYLDREIDARNPRTARRALASGTLAPAAMLWAIAAGIAVLLSGRPGCSIRSASSSCRSPRCSC